MRGAARGGGPGTRQGDGMTVRMGLLGAGRIGKVHARAIQGEAGAALVAVADHLDRVVVVAPADRVDLVAVDEGDP